MGDIAQGIYSFRGTNNWNKLNKVVFKNEADIKYMDKSYRTTIEIMNEANKVMEDIKEKLNIKLAVPVSRHGELVLYENKKNINDIINRFIDKGYKNIGIITKDEIECKNTFSKIDKQFENVKIIIEEKEKYDGGITVLPSYYSKGLEFDATIIIDYKKYNDTLLDKKLVYVALTRAMHEMTIM